MIDAAARSAPLLALHVHESEEPSSPVAISPPSIPGFDELGRRIRDSLLT